MSKRTFCATLATAALAIQPQVAAAQANCIEQDEVSAMAIYAVPSALRGLQQTCGDRLSPSGFLAREGGRLANRYAGLQNRVWPRAKSGMLKLATSRAAGRTWR